MRRRALGMLLSGAALAACSQASFAEELGRLFFTPEQRAALDARRKARVPDKPAANVSSPTMRLDGYVRRSSGRSTVWVNREALDEASPESPRIGAGPDAGVTVGVGESRARVTLKPGETLDRDNGQVKDVIGDGGIRVRRVTP